MKKLGILLIGLVAFTTSCDKSINKYKQYQPVYTDAATFRTPATFEAPRSVNQDGRIYFKDDHLFIVEPNEGIHLFDNTNPAAPQNVGFLNIMGASGLAIRGDYLYVTALVDLVIIDVSSFYAPVEVARMEETFPTALPLMDKNYPTETIDKNKGIVTSWTINEVKEEDDLNWSPQWINCLNCDVSFALESSTNSAGSGGGSATGTAGSFAMMTIVDEHLFVIDNNRLRPFSLSTPTAPKEGQETYLSWNVETVFPADGYLYMGTTTGMMIYNISDPNMPYREGSITHARACDPVVVQDNYAYVTVRSGGSCGGDINQLDVVDISNKSNPWLVQSFDLKNPHGVGIDGNTLFVCDGDDGLKVFNATIPAEVGDHLIKKFGNIQATDVIPINGVAMVIGDDGLYQYDYSDPENLTLLSEIKF